MLKRIIWSLALCVFIILSGCMSADDKEVNRYIELMQEDFSESAEINQSLTKYIELIIEGKAEEGFDILTGTTIPLYEQLFEEYKEMEPKNEDVQDLHEHILYLTEIDLKRQQILKRTFEIIIEDFQTNPKMEINFATELDELFDLTEEITKAQLTLTEKLQYLSEEYRGLKLDEEIKEEELTLMDPDGLNEVYALLIWDFIIAIAGEDLDIDQLKASISEDNDTADNDNESESGEVDTADSSTSGDIAELLKDQGNPHIVFDAEVTIDDTFYLTGKSNLLEGSTVELTSYQFGSENPYFKTDMTVDENGGFELKVDVDEDDLTGAPLTLHLGYKPENEDPDIHEIHGEEGELLEGPFAQKYTSIKRTRHGAFTYAVIDLQQGETAQFGVRDWDRPDDYGDVNVWIKEEKVDIHDDYYDITMTSNLNELTRTRTTIEIPGYDIAGYSARAYVQRDGSFRFQIPRITDQDLEAKEDVIFVIEAVSDASLETEELYGAHGENFKGDLVEKTKRGQKIEYKFNLHDVK